MRRLDVTDHVYLTVREICRRLSIISIIKDPVGKENDLLNYNINGDIDASKFRNC